MSAASRYDIVASPPPPENILHVCEMENAYSYEAPRGCIYGTIVSCQDCGKLWYAYSERGVRWEWRKVRWYSWYIKRVLKDDV